MNSEKHLMKLTLNSSNLSELVGKVCSINTKHHPLNGNDKTGYDVNFKMPKLISETYLSVWKHMNRNIIFGLKYYITIADLILVGSHYVLQEKLSIYIPYEIK